VLVLGEAVRSRRALALEQQRSERLLLNVLPAPIAERLKAGEG
jgi:adenylate cyclase